MDNHLIFSTKKEGRAGVRSLFAAVVRLANSISFRYQT